MSTILFATSGPAPGVVVDAAAQHRREALRLHRAKRRARRAARRATLQRAVRATTAPMTSGRDLGRLSVNPAGSSGRADL
jgi:hypothetical protein